MMNDKLPTHAVSVSRAKALHLRVSEEKYQSGSAVDKADEKNRTSAVRSSPQSTGE
jgi:hypothetical protein